MDKTQAFLSQTKSTVFDHKALSKGCLFDLQWRLRGSAAFTSGTVSEVSERSARWPSAPPEPAFALAVARSVGQSLSCKLQWQIRLLAAALKLARYSTK
jgi:hypothetical protein